MSTTTTYDVRHLDTEAGTDKPSFFARLIASRERHAKTYVAAFLARQSDEQLAGLGFTAEQIAAIRRTGEIPSSFWR